MPSSLLLALTGRLPHHHSRRPSLTCPLCAAGRFLAQGEGRRPLRAHSPFHLRLVPTPRAAALSLERDGEAALHSSDLQLLIPLLLPSSSPPPLLTPSPSFFLHRRAGDGVQPRSREGQLHEAAGPAQGAPTSPRSPRRRRRRGSRRKDALKVVVTGSIISLQSSLLLLLHFLLSSSSFPFDDSFLPVSPPPFSSPYPAQIADNCQDYGVANYLDSVLQDQANEIKRTADYVAELRRVGKGPGVWMWDQQMLQRLGA